MEIAFLMAPEANTEMNTLAPAACPRQEFSVLLAAFLKSAQPGTVIESGLLERDGHPVFDGDMSAVPSVAEDSELFDKPDFGEVQTPDAVPSDTFADILLPGEFVRRMNEGTAPSVPHKIGLATGEGERPSFDSGPAYTEPDALANILMPGDLTRRIKEGTALSVPHKSGLATSEGERPSFDSGPAYTEPDALANILMPGEFTRRITEGTAPSLPHQSGLPASEGERPSLDAGSQYIEPVALTNISMPGELTLMIKESAAPSVPHLGESAGIRKAVVFKADVNSETVAEAPRQLPLTENKNDAIGKGRVELSKGFENTGGLKEHFEIEIPAEEIMNQVVDEPLAEPALVAGGEKAGSAKKVYELSQALTAPLEPSSMKNENTDNATGGEIKAAGESNMELSAASFQEPETGGRGHSEDTVAQNASFEKEAVKPENGAVGLAFEKVISQQPQSINATVSRQGPVATEVHEKLQAGIRISVENNGGEVRMKLHPESLGEVRIRLSVNEGMVKAEIMVENPEVKAIIESDASFLKESLGAHGLSLDKCVVEVGRSFDARHRDGNENPSSHGEEHRPARDKGEEKGNNGWHRHFRKNHLRHEEGGVDFFA